MKRLKTKKCCDHFKLETIIRWLTLVFPTQTTKGFHLFHTTWFKCLGPVSGWLPLRFLGDSCVVSFTFPLGGKVHTTGLLCDFKFVYYSTCITSLGSQLISAQLTLLVLDHKWIINPPCDSASLILQEIFKWCLPLHGFSGPRKSNIKKLKTSQSPIFQFYALYAKGQTKYYLLLAFIFC